MMDFRDISPKTVTWRRHPAIHKSKGGIYANRLGENIKFQIPKMNCRVEVHSPGMFRLELKMSPSIAIHSEFMDWIADLEQSSKGPWGNLIQSPAVYNNGLRVMFFTDTNCFDSTGNLSADFKKARSASAIVSLVGLWVTDSKYGLKFKIEQLKYSEDAIPYPADTDSEATPVGGGYMFVDDD
jgi:hypothetical protein